MPQPKDSRFRSYRMKNRLACIGLRNLAQRFLCVGSFLSVSIFATATPAPEKWEPVPGEDLAATECKSYPGSNVELLLVRQELDTDAGRQVVRYYRRAKIYRTVGAGGEGVLNVDYPEAGRILSLAARLTKTDGKQLEFTRGQFTESLVEKSRRSGIKRLVLPVPDLDPGDILEFRWTETVGNSVTTYQWWYNQTEFPIRLFEFSINRSQNDCHVQAFNQPPIRENAPPSRHGVKLEVRDIPPFYAEPLMPAARDVRGWFMLYYSPQFLRREPNESIWQEISKDYGDRHRFRTKPRSAIKAKAGELLRGATTDEEKLRRLYDFCQQGIFNFEYFDSAEMQKMRRKNEWDHTVTMPEDTLKRKSGYAHQINELFAALARAAGYEVQLALSANGDTTLNVRHSTGWAFLEDRLVAVRLEDTWRCYSPGDYYVPAGMLDRANEGATSLICDPKKIIFETNSVSVANKSPVVRKGRFTLDAEGNLSGEVEIAMGGHAGIAKKKYHHGELDETVDEEYRSQIAERLPTAEVSDLRWENLHGSKLPLIVRYKLTVPGYANIVGSRRYLPVNVFEHGNAAFFTSEHRKYGIHFDFAWSERDDIEIILPAGLALDAGSTPADIGDATSVLAATYQIGYSAKERKLVYTRDFALGRDGTVVFPAETYPALKSLFDDIDRSDEHVLVLKTASAATVDEAKTAHPVAQGPH